MSSDPVLVTGATGNAGREVVAALRARGAPARAGVRDPGRVSALPPEVARRRLDFEDAATFDAALDGCRGVFLLRPPAIARVKGTLNAFIDRAYALEAGPVVFLSVAGAEKNRFVPHASVEAHLTHHGSGYTLLRPGFFAQNLQDAYLEDIRDDDRLYVPAGRGRVTFVDLRDVAEVAARALLEPDAHDARAYTLTGPRADTFDDVAAALTQTLDRPIRYEPASIPGYLGHVAGARGLSVGQALVQTVLHVGLRFGQAEAVDPTLEQLLGRPPRTIDDYVLDHAEIWRPGRRAPSGEGD